MARAPPAARRASHGGLFSEAVYADMTYEMGQKHGFEGFSK
jgi:hypothetical protein